MFISNSKKDRLATACVFLVAALRVMVTGKAVIRFKEPVDIVDQEFPKLIVMPCSTEDGSNK